MTHRRRARFISTSLTLLTLLVVRVTSQCPSDLTMCKCFTNSANQYTISCSGQNLRNLSDSFPSNTSVILMPNNLVTDIRVGPVSFLPELRDLYLQDNYISYIQPGAFAGSFKLQQIILANNYLKSINRDMFSHLPLLSVIDLSRNQITTIDRYSFFYLPSLVLVNLGSNKLNCGCEEKLLKQFLDTKIGNLSLTYAQCTNFGNISITDVNQNTWDGVPNCQDETLFRPLDSRQCYQCSDAKGMVDCQIADNLQQCYGEQMWNNTTDPSMLLCTRSDNYSCWSQLVTVKNMGYAIQMTPVIVMMITFAVIGVVGNVIVIVMYSTRKQRTSANVFIMVLAGIDLFACVMIHPYVVYKLFNFYSQTWTGTCKVFEFLVHVNLGLSGLALMLIAVDRYLAICKPVKYLKFDEHVMKGIVVVVVVSVVCSIPLLEFYGPNPENFDMTEGIFLGYRCHYQEKYIGSISIAAFSGFILCAFLVEIIAMSILYKNVAVVAYRKRRTVVPLSNAHTLAGFKPSSSVYSSRITTSSTLTTKIDVTPCSSHINLQTISRSTRDVTSHDSSNTLGPHSGMFCVTTLDTQTQKRTGGDPSERYTLNDNQPIHEIDPAHIHTKNNFGQLTQKRLKAAKILFTVTIVFFLSWMPFFVMRICNSVTNDQCHLTSYVGEIIEELLNHVFYINNAINPILYTIINKTFRQEFAHLVRKRCSCRP